MRNVTTDLESAEMIQYVANIFLETKITFINDDRHSERIADAV